MEFGVNSIIIFIICYLIGSFPTGYFFVKTICKKDITREGSGNVGTFNALKVSGSKAIGVIVLIIDFLKGAIPVLLLILVFDESMTNVYISSIFLIIGHNFSVWLKFKGGRGLAASAGIFAVLNYWILALWCLVWVIFFIFKKDVLISNFFATLFIPLFAILLDKYSVDNTIRFLNPSYNNLLAVFVVCISLLVLFKHVEVLAKIFPFYGKNFNK